MIPEKLNDSGDCLCQCPAGSNEWCHCNDNPDGTGSSIENPVVVDLIWKEQQKNGSFKYFAVQSGNNKQNLPVVLPTASLTKRGVVQLTNDLSDREDLAVTPKGLSSVKATVDKETAERIANDNEINKRINKEIVDRGNADTALANRISTLEQHEGNHVTSVVSDGNATVTVTKQNGTTNQFTINNVAHASSADNATNATNATNAGYATNAGHASLADRATKATTADSATNANHADVADKVKNLDTNQLGKVSFLSSRTGDGNWTLSNVVVNKPIFITHNAGAYPGGCHLTVVSGSNDLKTTHHFGTWSVLSGQLFTTIGAGACAIVIPTKNTVVIKVNDTSDDGDTLRAYQ